MKLNKTEAAAFETIGVAVWRHFTNGRTVALESDTSLTEHEKEKGKELENEELRMKNEELSFSFLVFGLECVHCLAI